ncbi:hypothetical protein [Weissella kandleri]|nr:hypothetical protein [Weissella kandleri]
MTAKGSIKSNDFARGAAQQGQVKPNPQAKMAAKKALLEKARAQHSAK